MSRVTHFEINTADPARAADFYGRVFGWEITKWEGPEEYWLVTTGKEGDIGINGGIMRSQDGQPRTVNTIQVETIDNVIAKITTSGGQIAMPKMAIPGIGWQAYCIDPQGCLFGVHQADPKAR